MLLTVDIGNTNINFGIFKGARLIKKFFIPTNKYNFRKLKLKISGVFIQDAIICSVVPKASRIVAEDLKILLAKRPILIGRDISVPVKNRYRKPRQVGQDRLVNAYAGLRLYGAPLIVVDFGTAVTFDVVSQDREYLGGMIIPGLQISLDTLNQRTALLPRTKLERPKEFIGRDTKKSILSGIVYGFACLTDDLVMKIRHRIGRRARVVGTGGDIDLLHNYCRRLDRINKDLTLKGLYLIYDDMAKLKKNKN